MLSVFPIPVEKHHDFLHPILSLLASFCSFVNNTSVCVHFCCCLLRSCCWDDRLLFLLFSVSASAFVLFACFLFVCVDAVVGMGRKERKKRKENKEKLM